MGLLEVIILCFVVVLVAIFAFYYITDYQNYKSKTDTRLDQDEVNAVSGQRTLSGNLKNVVDQQNSINDTIYTTFAGYSNAMNTNFSSLQTIWTGYSNVMNANLFDVRTLLKQQGDIQNNYMLGMSNVFTLGSVIDTGLTPSPAFSPGVFNMPGVRNPDIRLLNHVTAVSGVTIRDLRNDMPTTRLNVCSTDGRCIQIPDSNGNTFITTMAPSKAIIMDGSVGIGTTAPAAQLDVQGDVVVRGTLKLGAKTVKVDPTTGALTAV